MNEIYDVFTPGRATELTYVDRTHKSVATDLTTQLNRGGKFISLVGPTKMGKTVLVEKTASDAVTIQGQSISNVNDLWSRLAAHFGIPTTTTAGKVNSDTSKWGFAAKLGIDLAGFGANLGGEHTLENSAAWTTELYADQVLPDVVKAARKQGYRVNIALDDFHFIDTLVRKEVIQALKPLVHQGASVIIITLPHRRSEASRLVRDVGGRTVTLEVEPWLRDDLEKIAIVGFSALKLRDSHELRKRLAEEAYGSPFIMQQLCLELCERVNNITRSQAAPRDLNAPQSWTDFWRLVHDEDSSDWLQKLDAGPKTRGQTRNIHNLKNGQKLDGYGVILAAIRALIPKRSTSEDHSRLSFKLSELNDEITEILADTTASKINASTKLGHMSSIAAKSLDQDAPVIDSEDESIEDPAEGAPQPVFEYVSEKEAIHILEPYLAYTLKWHSDGLIGADGGFESDESFSDNYYDY